MVKLFGNARRPRGTRFSRAIPLTIMVALVALLWGAGCERLVGIHSSSKAPGDAGGDRGAGNGGHDAVSDARPSLDGGNGGTTATDASPSDHPATVDADNTGDAAPADAASDGAADRDPAVPLCGADPSVGSPIRATAFRFGGGPNNSSDPNGKGQCGFPNEQLPKGMFYGAVDTALYANSSRCGACMRLVSGGVSVDVQVIDVVPASASAHGATLAIDQDAQTTLSPAGGNPDVQFSFIPCVLTGNIRVAFQGALDPSVVVMGYRNELKTVELVTAGTTQNMNRQSYNVWRTAAPFGGGRVSLVLTDVFGNTVRTPDMALSTAFVDTGQQFPRCPDR